MSRCLATSCADLTEIGCSSEQPPKMIPTFNLSMLLPAFNMQALDETVLHGVPQGVVRVIGGVRTDQHVRQLVQPQQQPAFHGLVAGIRRKKSFPSFRGL